MHYNMHAQRRQRASVRLTGNTRQAGSAWCVCVCVCVYACVCVVGGVKVYAVRSEGSGGSSGVGGGVPTQYTCLAVACHYSVEHGLLPQPIVLHIFYNSRCNTGVRNPTRGGNECMRRERNCRTRIDFGRGTPPVSTTLGCPVAHSRGSGRCMYGGWRVRSSGGRWGRWGRVNVLLLNILLLNIRVRGHVG